MSKKVILTQEQAKELKGFKKLGRTLEDWISNKNNPHEPNSELHQLKLDEMAKVLYTGDYEIEPEQQSFQPGDKLYSPITGIFNVTSCTGSIVSVKELSYPLPAKEYRHATQEEIYWLETLGREKVRDFRIGDVLIGDDQCSYVIGRKTEVESGFLSLDDVESFLPRLGARGIMPFESFKRLPKEESK